MRTTMERILVVIGVVIAATGVALVWMTGVKYETQLTELRRVQDELSTVQNRRATYQRLVQNLLAYSQSQPAIDSVLVPFGFKTVQAQPAQSSGQAQPQQSPQAQPQQSQQPLQQLQQFQNQTQQPATGAMAPPSLRPSPSRSSTPAPAPK